jgi:hypothetical protein
LEPAIRSNFPWYKIPTRNQNFYLNNGVRILKRKESKNLGSGIKKRFEFKRALSQGLGQQFPSLFRTSNGVFYQKGKARKKWTFKWGLERESDHLLEFESVQRPH